MPGDVTIELVTGFISFEPYVLLLEQEGLVKITNSRKCGGWIDPNSMCGDINLTEKGIKASPGWVRTDTPPTPVIPSHAKYAIPIASRVVKDIDGIREEPMVGTVATFTWGCQVNDLGKTFKGIFLRPSPNRWTCPFGDRLNKSSALFKRYDDGWRLEQISW
jgi:hypothetical protein